MRRQRSVPPRPLGPGIPGARRAAHGSGRTLSFERHWMPFCSRSSTSRPRSPARLESSRRRSHRPVHHHWRDPGLGASFRVEHHGHRPDPTACSYAFFDRCAARHVSVANGHEQQRGWSERSTPTGGGIRVRPASQSGMCSLADRCLPGRRDKPAFPLVRAYVEPPGGIEPPTPSLPWMCSAD